MAIREVVPIDANPVKVSETVRKVVAEEMRAVNHEEKVVEKTPEKKTNWAATVGAALAGAGAYAAIKHFGGI